MTQASMGDALDKIAVIGMAGRYPHAKDIEQFWQNLREGRECISFYTAEQLIEAGVSPELVARPDYVRAEGSCAGTYMFDASFFGFSPREAELLDPQHRMFLECAWEAIEHAAYDPWSYPGRIGVFAGSGPTQYLFELLTLPGIWSSTNDIALSTYADRDFLAMRIGYKMNLRGPCLTVQTACSTSLVAIVLACQSLLNYQADIALAGGVRLNTQERSGYLSHEGGILSPDGHCRAFDAEAKGTVGSVGCGVVVLKRLEDALADGDTIHAVVLGTGLNNDGASRVSFAAPGLEGQTVVVSDALAMADINPETIGFVECHGTATPMGDPIEVAALTRAFRAHTQKKHFCAIGSVKSNIGHTDTAAGVAGFIKAVLALERKLIPATVNFRTPNPEIDFASSPFFVNSEAMEWKGGTTPRRAAVTSLGLGGTNAHVILEEPPSMEPLPSARTCRLLVWSAKTSSALETMSANLLAHLKDHPEDSIGDVAYTLQVGRRVFPHRRMLVCREREDAIAALESSAPDKLFQSYREEHPGPTAFAFPGQGAQHLNMAKGIYDGEPIFRKHVDECSRLLKPHMGLDLREVLYPAETRDRLAAATRLTETEITQPALFVIEYALARLWMEWGIRPQSMIGHSIGEYVAACLADVLSLEDALRLVAARGRLMQRLPGGAMLVAPIPEQEARTLLKEGLSLAAVNGPASCVISGEADRVEQLDQELRARGVAGRRLTTSHAFHSAMMEPILSEFEQECRKTVFSAPRIPYLSNVSGTWITEQEARDPHYWVTHLRQTVRFSDGISKLLKDPNAILLEVGPGRTLSSLASHHPSRGESHVVLSSLPHPKNDLQSDLEFLFTTAGQLWLEGVKVDWKAFYGDERRRRIPLPSYPFEREYYRLTPQHGHRGEVEAQIRAASSSVASQPQNQGVAADKANGKVTESALGARHRRPRMATPYVAPQTDLERAVASVWQDTIGIESLGVNDNYAALGGDSLLAIQVAARVRDLFQVEFAVSMLYQAPTVAGMAKTVASMLADKPAATMGKVTTADSLVERRPGSAGEGIPPGAAAEMDNGGRRTEWPVSQIAPSPLVTIRESGSKPPLFLVHPVGGGVMAYYDLAKYLDVEQPVYALQNHDLGSRADCVLVSIEEMATRYIEAVQKAQPTGPYLLGGSSMGGMVAFEMAQQLSAHAQEVALVAMIDTAARIEMPSDQNESPQSRRARELTLLSKVIGLPEGKELQFSPAELECLQPAEQVDYFFQKMKDQELVPVRVDTEVFRAAFRTFSNNLMALERYTPRSYAGRVAVLRASDVLEETKALAQDLYEDPSFGWQAFCTHPVSVQFVPGDHVRINLEPHVGVLGSKLQLTLEEAIESSHGRQVAASAAAVLGSN
jgi:phthiocerol/phenolphthiocerol synthesis type-I polyketide synthase E